MKKDVLRGVKQYNASRKRRKNWQKVVMLMACVVVFCTTYALILPAITMEGQQCQIPEHTHTDECYTLKTTAARQVLHCSYESLGVHQHTEDCYDDDGNLICGQEDFVAHTHDETCYDANGALVCELPEIKPHTHDESCYTLPQPHVHDESCYERVRGELICTESTEAAEEATDVQICELPEDENHTHGEGCYEKAPAAQPHVHTDECYAWENVLVCDKSTEPDPNARPVLTCEEPEIIPHTHTEECYDKDGNLVCGEVELLVHQHTASCFETLEEPLDTTALTCTLPENENHTHTDHCYGRWELTCGLEEHTHSLVCYADPQADVETAENWEATFASAMGSGDWRKDAAAIAKTQLGYTESKDNYIVGEDGETVKGYTRYGAWFGQPYGDWNALFASFCLNYAGAEITGQTCQDLITALGEYYVNPAEHAPQAGEPVFLDMDGDGAADQVGILTEIAEEAAETGEGEAAAVKRTLTVISGDLAGEMGDAVREERYSEASVVGYGAVPKAAQPFTLTAQTEGGITVTVSGEDSSLPYPAEEITLTAEEVVDEDSLALRDELLEKNEEEAQWLFLLDITLWHGEEKIEPIGPVQVTFSGLETNGLYPEVYHIDTEKREAVDMSVTTDEDGNVMMDTDHFSLFAARALEFEVIELNDSTQIFQSQIQNKHVKLTGNGSAWTSEKIQIESNSDTIIDLNGHVLYFSPNVSGESITVASGGRLVIMDSAVLQKTDNDVRVITNDNIHQNKDTFATLDKNGDAPSALHYYVTKSNIDEGGLGTTETLGKYTVSGFGSIVAQNDKCLVMVESGGNFELQGGLLTATKNRVVYNNGGTTRISGGYIAGGNANDGWGGGILCEGGNLSMTGGVIAANQAKSGGGIALKNGTLEMSGGIISGNSVWEGADGDYSRGYGGGVFTDGTATTISGEAYITNNRIPKECGVRGAGCHGGGGIATRGGSLGMTGGYVTGNYSGEAGGGMYIGQWFSTGTTFTMSGGTVASNFAAFSEGGGISIRGHGNGDGKELQGSSTGTIKADPGSKLYITNNKTATTIDWGGGGIFVQKYAHLDIQNALITDNDANGFGGGVGACPTGETLIVHEDGAAIYGNRIQASQMSAGYNGKFQDRDIALPDYTAKYKGKEQQGYKDYFCVRDENEGTSEISLVTGEMIGGGAANWFGSCDRNEITISKTGHVAADYLFGLTAKPSPEDKGKAQNAAQVIITGNSSGTHGGGIMTNGGLIIGNTHDDIVTVAPSLDITGLKTLIKDNVCQSDDLDFNFKLYEANENWVEGEEKGSATADKTSGKFTISPNKTYEDAGDYYYVLKEINDGRAGVKYDTTEYRFKVHINRNETTLLGIRFVSYSVDSVQVWKSTQNGGWEELSGAVGSGGGSGIFKLRFKNACNWNKVWLYIWESGEYNTKVWPGDELTIDSEGWYTRTFNVSGNSTFNYIINNGFNEKTGDLTASNVVNKELRVTWTGNDTSKVNIESVNISGGEDSSDIGFTATANPDGSYSLALQGDTFTNHTTASVSLKIVKKDEEHPEKLLEGATFRLREAGVTDQSKDVTMSTDQNGEVTFTGLKKGTNYYLWEDTAPANYYKAGPWILEIGGNGGGKLYTAKEENGTLEKTNEGTDLGSEGTDPIVLTANISDKPWGYELPATGGTGTGWYTLGGLLMTLLAAGLLVYNKKGRKGGVAFL